MQLVCDPGQVGVPHAPLMHTLPDLHVAPHLPQLAESVLVSTQRPPHVTCPGGQVLVGTHAVLPATEVVPLGHARQTVAPAVG